MTHAGPTHDALVRTTVTIDDELYEAVRLQACVERRTLGAVINELLARGLEHRRGATRVLAYPITSMDART